MWRSEDMSYLKRTASGNFISRMNMVGTMKMVSILLAARSAAGIPPARSAASAPARRRDGPCEAERVWRGMIERPGQQRRECLAAGHRSSPAYAPSERSLFGCRRVATNALGMARRARSVDHVLRLRHRRSVIGRLPTDPGFEIDCEIRRRKMIGVDLVSCARISGGDGGTERGYAWPGWRRAKGATGRHGRSRPARRSPSGCSRFPPA